MSARGRHHAEGISREGKVSYEVSVDLEEGKVTCISHYGGHATQYAGCVFVEAETTVQSLEENDPVHGTLRLYVNREKPNPDYKPSDPLPYKTKKTRPLEREIEDVEIPLDMVALMRFEVINQSVQGIDLSQEGIEKLF